jgi:hypothetical protein
MAIDFNGFTALGSIGAHPGAFPDIAAEARKVARSLIVKQLKKTAKLDSTRGIRKALGNDTFDLIIDSMTDAEVKTLLGKLDKYHPSFKTSGSGWRRQQLLALADGSAEPAERPKAWTKSKSGSKSASRNGSKTKASSEEPSRLSSLAMGAVRKRRE